jgi:hypothetical protein
VTYQAFLRSGARFRKISRDTVERTDRETAAHIDALRARATPLHSLPAAFPTTEPVVLAYVIEALVEPSDDPEELSEEELWQVLHILATAAACLHEAGTPPKGATFTP